MTHVFNPSTREVRKDRSLSEPPQASWLVAADQLEMKNDLALLQVLVHNFQNLTLCILLTHLNTVELWEKSFHVTHTKQNPGVG